MDRLEAIGPIDGRYRRITDPLAEFFSEKGLIKYRVMVEGEYLINLASLSPKGIRRLSPLEVASIRKLYDVSTEDAAVVKAIETKGHGSIKATNHDVKAVEYFMKEKLKGGSLDDMLEFIHFALTSEDTNNLAYALMLSDGIEKVVLPSAESLHDKIREASQRYKEVPMLARTHGQPASPTTFGKEFLVYAERLKRQLDQLKKYEISAKLNGATGNYNAHHAAHKGMDWLGFTSMFIEGLNSVRKIRLKPNFITTQIEPHDTYAELFDIIKRFNTVMIDFNQDMWRYISDDWIKQKPVEGEVGSSTMPHKVNPIDFENSESNLAFANSMFEFFARKLPISRLQRDLSDSTIERNFGVALGHSLIGYESAKKGLGKVSVNEQEVIGALEKHPEIISEAIQTILRREGAPMPYERLKELTRGKKVTMEVLREFIDGLDVSKEVKDELNAITPTNYTGIAKKLCEIDSRHLV